eukprot:4556519-Pyramimonas_sp.AAC.1
MKTNLDIAQTFLTTLVGVVKCCNGMFLALAKKYQYNIQLKIECLASDINEANFRLLHNICILPQRQQFAIKNASNVDWSMSRLVNAELQTVMATVISVLGSDPS